MGERLFKALAVLALVAQFILVSVAFSLDPMSPQGQRMFGGLVASSFIILSMLLYAYKGYGGVVKPTGKGLEDPNDQEWYAAGLAFIILILLMTILA